MTIKDLLIKGKIESRDEYEMFMDCASIEVDEQVDYKILDARIIFSNECFCEIYVSEDPEDESEYIQNEELSFRVAAPDDWWFHAKGVPGSHVILKANGTEPPDRAFEEAAALAAHFSRSSALAKADVDYTLRRNLRKVNGAPPGFVIYHTNYSMTVAPSASLSESK